MKGCHSCEHSAAIARGAFADREWDKVPCSTCDVMSGVGYAVDFEDWRKTQNEFEVHETYRPEEDLELDVLPVSVLSDCLIGFLKLPPAYRDVIAWRYAGMRYEDIGLAQGVTEACAEKRHSRALELWPELGELFPQKVSKRAHRKKSVNAQCRMRHERGIA